MKKAIGLDIGGTKVAAGIILESGELVGRAEVKSDPSSREAMLAQVIKAVEQVLHEASLSINDVAGIGVGIPGKVDRERGIAVFQNNLPWANYPISAQLHERLGAERIVIDNDVYMAAYAEWKAVGGNKSETFVYVTISTGISCAIIHQGSFFRGAGFAGELGLTPVSLRPDCKELVRLENAASGPAIERQSHQMLKDGQLTAKDIFERYKDGFTEYRPIIEQVTGYWAEGLYSLTCILDPHKVVFGGSVIANNPFLLNAVKEKLEKYQIPEQRHLLNHISISTIKQDNGVSGAGLRVFEEF